MIKTIKIILALTIALILTTHTGCAFMKNKIYSGMIGTGAPCEYPVLFDSRSYLYNQDKSHREPFMGMLDYVGWGHSNQASSGFESPMMTGIHVRWYSITEDQFWEGDGDFDTALMEKVINNKVATVSDEKEPVESISYSVSVAPNGYVAVWAYFEGDQYVLTTFYTHKVEEDNFAAFHRRAWGSSQYVPDVSYEQFWENRKHSKNGRLKACIDATLAKKAQGIPPTEAYYKSLMQPYHWQLKMLGPFEIERYKAFHLSDEITQVSYEDIKTRLAAQYSSPPEALSLYVINTDTREQYYMQFFLDKDEVLQAFQEMVKRVGNDQLIDFEVFFQREPLDGQIYLRSGKERIAINSKNSRLNDYPEKYKHP